jgi:hypothetical protein
MRAPGVGSLVAYEISGLTIWFAFFCKDAHSAAIDVLWNCALHPTQGRHARETYRNGRFWPPARLGIF